MTHASLASLASLGIPRAHPAKLSDARGFTFVEILAALFFLALLVPVITQAVTLANRASVVAERSLFATELAGNKLNEILLTNDLSETQGNFGEDWPDYHWQLSLAQWENDSSMTELTLEVFFPVQGSERSVALGTLADLSGTSGGSLP